MKNKSMKLLAFCLLLGTMAANADPITLTFDDICGEGPCAGLVPNGYGGLDWSGIMFMQGDAYRRNSGMEFGVVSGEYIAFSSSQNSITSDTPFELVGLYLTSAFMGGLDVNIWTENYLFHTELDIRGPTYIQLNWTDVTSVHFWSYGADVCRLYPCSSDWVMDNLTVDFHEVPEPASLALFGLGLAGIGVSRRKKA